MANSELASIARDILKRSAVRRISSESQLRDYIDRETAGDLDCIPMDIVCDMVARGLRKEGITLSAE